MRKLLFFSRVAFICNICFLLSFLLQLMPAVSNSGFSSTLVIMGRLLALVLTALLVIVYVIAATTSRNLFEYVPAWLVITNFVLFVAQVIFLIK